MKLSTILLFLFISTRLTQAVSLPQLNDIADPMPLIDQLIDKRFQPEEKEQIYNMFQKRDTTLTISSLLNALNRSQIIFSALDLVAYSPKRIAFVANSTSKLVGDVNITALTLSNLKLDLNYTRIYDGLIESGVVSSLLRGILLDESYRPVLVKLINRLLEGNKNLFNYVVKNLFKKSKRDEIFSKRDYKGTLESFVAGILSAALNSDFVGGIALDTLTALNETQFLTYTVKEFIANEGYQNMTAQLVLDMVNSGNIKINTNAVNITSILNKALSKPAVVLSIVSNVLSGNLQLPALGEYASAVKAILLDVQSSGTFADLNQYVFSESHAVTMPIVPTNQIVVPKNVDAQQTGSAIGGYLNLLSPKNKTSTSTLKSSTSTLVRYSLLLLNGGGFALSNYLGLLGGKTSTTTSSLQGTSSSKATISTAKSLSSGTGTSLSPAQSSAEVNSILSLLRASTLPSATNQPTTTQPSTTAAASGSVDPGLMSLLNLLGSLSSKINKRDVSSCTSTKAASVNGGLIIPAFSLMNVLLLGTAYLF